MRSILARYQQQSLINRKASLPVPIFIILIAASLFLCAADAAAFEDPSNDTAIARGRGFLLHLFRDDIQLLPEFDGHHVVWLYHDNYLAAKVLAKSHPETSKRILQAIRGFGVERSGKIELLFGESKLPLRRYELRDVDTKSGFRIRSEFSTDELMKDFSRYADLLLFASIAEPDTATAKQHWDDALRMWDGTGFVDPATEKTKIYATYKLALSLLAAKKNKVESESLTKIREKLRRMQSESGGWITDYRADGTPVGFANVETTCLAIMALEE